MRTPLHAAQEGGNALVNAISIKEGGAWVVRRLTPLLLEGERLQGWPDNSTQYRHDGTRISDSARWRIIGNGVATPVAKWLAERLFVALTKDRQYGQ